MNTPNKSQNQQVLVHQQQLIESANELCYNYDTQYNTEERSY